VSSGLPGSYSLKVCVGRREHFRTSRPSPVPAGHHMGQMLTIQRWSIVSSPSMSSTRTSPQPEFFSSLAAYEQNKMVTQTPSKRTFFLIDRFTDTSRVEYVSNDVIFHSSSVSAPSCLVVIV
jgi:hypothetical protein